MYWLYEKISDKPHDLIELESASQSYDLIEKAKKLTTQWAQVGITRHYRVMYFSNTVWEN